jgi:hypothetical protein
LAANSWASAAPIPEDAPVINVTGRFSCVTSE